MNVLGLFDGYCGGRIALTSLGFKVDTYYSSEIDKHANVVSHHNNPENIALGDVTKWREWDVDWSSIDLILAGSPCQGFSDAGAGRNFEDPRSKLFFEFVDILEHVRAHNKHVQFMLENVDMKREWRDRISSILNVSHFFIDAEKVTPCKRPRNYWFNFPNPEIPSESIGVSDVVTDGFIHPSSITGRRIDPETGKRADSRKDLPIIQYLEVQPHNKARCVTTVSKDSVLSSLPPGRYPNAYKELRKGIDWREPTLKELCSWHGVPENYFECVSESQARKMLGNGWNIKVIALILQNLKPKR